MPSASRSPDTRRQAGGATVRVTSHEIDLRVTQVRPGGAKLKASRGVNSPDTNLRLDALTSEDLDDLDFVARHADMVSLSFVYSGETGVTVPKAATGQSAKLGQRRT
jgi:pyruvate kinase